MIVSFGRNFGSHTYSNSPVITYPVVARAWDRLLHYHFGWKPTTIPEPCSLNVSYMTILLLYNRSRGNERSDFNNQHDTCSLPIRENVDTASLSYCINRWFVLLVFAETKDFASFIS